VLGERVSFKKNPRPHSTTGLLETDQQSRLWSILMNERVKKIGRRDLDVVCATVVASSIGLGMPWAATAEESAVIDQRLKDSPPLVSANLVIPYPPGFPIMVPGQVLARETLDFMRSSM
jgi:hypothetical protein